MSRGPKPLSQQPAWWIAYGVVCGLAAAGLLLLLAAPPRGEPIELLQAPTRTASPPAPAASSRATSTLPALPALPLDVNTASTADFERLPGIGPSTALLIVTYREQNGPFESLQDLLNIPGIGPRTLESILPFVMIAEDDR
ncbi:MAG: helix-hairpin-helix domain-containing protein [Anaerolineales bacterium]|nr:helix-hairpin-helix domain-containing protein [Anaerolineales bacterium]